MSEVKLFLSPEENTSVSFTRFPFLCHKKLRAATTSAPELLQRTPSSSPGHERAPCKMLPEAKLPVATGCFVTRSLLVKSKLFWEKGCNRYFKTCLLQHRPFSATWLHFTAYADVKATQCEIRVWFRVASSGLGNTWRFWGAEPEKGRL